MVEDNPWFLVCNLPHSLEHYIVAKSVQQEEMTYDYDRDSHTINMLEATPYQIDGEYSFAEEDGYEYDVGNQKYNVNMGR